MAETRIEEAAGIKQEACRLTDSGGEPFVLAVGPPDSGKYAWLSTHYGGPLCLDRETAAEVARHLLAFAETGSLEVGDG